jgi:hypothetical protein
MKVKSIGPLLLLWLFATSFCVAASPAMGTWKLNEAKSKFPAGATKNQTVKYEAAGDDIKVTVDGVDSKGAAAHNEWTGKFDGKDYPVTGDPTYDTRSYKQVDANTLSMTLKKGGKAVGSGKIVMSADGKSRTVTTTVTTADGKKMSVTAVYDKE